MEFRAALERNVVILAVSGRVLSAEEAAPLEHGVNEYLEQGVKDFVIDLEMFELANPAGIAMLLRCKTSVTKAGGRLNGGVKVSRVAVEKCTTWAQS